MVDVRRVKLPGVGVLHTFVTDDGGKVGVIAHRSGHSDLITFSDHEDGSDVTKVSLRLNDDEAHTLAELLGGHSRELAWAGSGPTVILMAGLQGSGKTTACAKLAHQLKSEGKSVALAACVGCLGCVGCRRCVLCIGCVDCEGCVLCIGCVGLRRGVRKVRVTA